MSTLKANAKEFVPSTPKKEDPKGIVVYKSSRYFGKAEDYEEIKRLFLSLAWHPDVKCVYVTNGWHDGFENGGWVSYCGYAPNVDSDIYKQHYYR